MSDRADTKNSSRFFYVVWAVETWAGPTEGWIALESIDHFPTAREIQEQIRKTVGDMRRTPLIRNVIEFRDEADYRSFMDGQVTV